MRTKLIVIVTLANLVTAFKIDQRSEVKECPSSFSKKEGVPGKCFHRSSNGFQQMMRARKYCEDKSSKLVEPKTKDELDEIDNFFKSQLGRKNYWVGYAKIQMTIFEECDTPLNDAEFRSINDFSPIPEGMWKRSEPNNHRSQGEWCVESEVGKGLNDENCDNDNSNDVVNVALCEYNLPSAAGGSKKDENDGSSENDESDEDDDATDASSEHDDAKKDDDSEEDEDDNSEEDDESNEDDDHNGDGESGEDAESNEDDENDNDDNEVGEDDSKDEDSDHSNTKKTPC